MKKKQITSVALLAAAILAQATAPSPVVAADPQTGSGIVQKNDVLTMAAKPSERYFSWYANDATPGQFIYEKTTETTPSATFSKNAKTINAEVETTENDPEQFIHRIHLTDLEPGATYKYRFINGETESEVQHFTIGGEGDYSFFFVGDPQLGSGGELNGAKGWNFTLSQMNTLDSGAHFLLSAGDNVDAGGVSDALPGSEVYKREAREYDAFLKPDQFRGLTFSTTPGNHDVRSSRYNEHFRVPNESEDAATIKNGIGDSYYIYNKTLFIVLNSNAMSTAGHKAFMEQAIQATAEEDIEWKVVVFHHAPYSTASHQADWDIVDRRNELSPVMKELAIDLVLNGHDHVYDRTFVMGGENGTTPLNEEGKDYIQIKAGTNNPEDADFDVTKGNNLGGYDLYKNPEGVVYLTANSASGSKFYRIRQQFDYARSSNQERVPNITHIAVDDEKGTLTATTYRSREDIDITSDAAIVDKVTIEKDSAKDAPEVPEVPETPEKPSEENTPPYINLTPVSPKDDPDAKPQEDDREDDTLSDIRGHWAEASIRIVLDKKLMDPIGKEFKPDRATDRMTVIKALARMENVKLDDYRNKESLKDLTPGSDEAAYINWAMDRGIIHGYEDKTFRPERSISREEIAKVLIAYKRAVSLETKNDPRENYRDENAIAPWAKTYVEEATESGLLKGHASGNFGPKESLKRAEVAQLVVNVLNLK